MTPVRRGPGVRMRLVGALFQVLLAAHVVTAILGFGSILVTGAYAHRAGSTSRSLEARGRDGSVLPASSGTGMPGLPASDGAGVPASVRRYFRPGPNWASRLIFVVPALGLALAGLGGWRDLRTVWLWVGAALWTTAAVVTAGVIWPAEARIQALVGAVPPGGDAGGELVRAGRRAARASGFVDVVAAAAFVVMLGRPGP